MADYTLAIKIDDTDLDKAIRKLQAVFKGIQIDGTGFSVAGGRSKDPAEQIKTEKTIKAFDRIRDVLGKIDKKQMALTGISFGIGAILGTLMDVSPLLQSTFKLLTTGIMLMLKPIADFIGLLLRPFMVLFLQYVVLPFYKHVYPWFSKYGTSVGEALSKAVTDPNQFFQDPFGNGTGGGDNTTYREWADGGNMSMFDKIIADIQTMFGNIGKFFDHHLVQPIFDAIKGVGEWMDQNLIKPLSEAWDSFIVWINDSMIVPLRDAWDATVKWFQENFTSEKISQAWNSVVGFLQGMSAGIETFVGSAWVNITTFFSNAGGDAVSWLQTRWDETTKFFSILASDASTWVTDRWNTLTQWFSNVASDANTWLKQVWDDITGFFMAILNAVSSVWDSLTSLWNKILRGRSSTSFSPARGVVGGTSRMAQGGIINEPIVGIGQRSGRDYLLGEAGSEAVVPLNKMGAGGGRPIIINVTVTNEAQLNALISKVKQELLLEQRRIGVI